MLDELGFLLKDPSEEVRMASLMAICWICKKEEMPSCIRFIKIALSDESPNIRARAVMNLSLFKTDEALDLTVVMADDANDHVRAASAITLGHFNNERSINKLILMLSDANGLVVTRAIESLSGFSDTRAKDAIVRMIDSDDEEIRRTAILSLSNFKDSEELIAGFLKSQDWATRLAAVQALSKINSQQAKTLLEEVLDSETDMLVKEAIEGALGV